MSPESAAKSLSPQVLKLEANTYPKLPEQVFNQSASLITHLEKRSEEYSEPHLNLKNSLGIMTSTVYSVGLKSETKEKSHSIESKKDEVELEKPHKLHADALN